MMKDFGPCTQGIHHVTIQIFSIIRDGLRQGVSRNDIIARMWRPFLVKLRKAQPQLTW